MRIARKESEKARIEIIPMIDVIFFLLVFFMISTLSMTINRGCRSICRQRQLPRRMRAIMSVSR